MATEFEEMVVRVRGEVSDAIAALKRVEAEGDRLEAGMAKNTKGIGKSLDGQTAATKKVADETTKTRKSVTSDLDKILAASDDARARWQRNFNQSNDATEALGKTVLELRARTKMLADLWNKTGDDKFLQRMEQSKKDAEALTKTSDELAKTLGKDVTKAAGDAGGAMGDLGYIIGGVVALAAPLLGGALAGGILAIVGGGGLAAGIAGQMNSPLVKDSLDQFGKNLSDEFHQVTSAFGPELESVLGSLDNNLGPFWASLQRGFTELAPYLKVVGDAFARFLNQSGPGIEAAFKGAEPVLTAIAVELPKMGQAITTFFQQLEKGGQGAGDAIMIVFEIVDTAIVELGYVLRGLSDAFQFIIGGLIKVFGALSEIPGPIGDKFKTAHDNLVQLDTQIATSTTDMATMNGTMAQTNDYITTQNQELQRLTDTFDELTNKELAHDNAQLRAIEASQAFSKALQKNRGDWKMTTQAGQEHWQALLNNIQAQKDLYDSDVKLHGVTKANTTAYDAAIEKLLGQAGAAGLSARQIADLRQRYENLNATLSKINGRKIHFTISATATGPMAGIAAGDVASAFSNSGVDYAGRRQFANSGIAGNIPHYDSNGIFAGRPGGLYRFAEASTGEEALIAKTGDRGRALGALTQAAGWHGAAVVTNPLSATYNHASVSNVSNSYGGPTMVATTVVVGSQAIVRAITPAVQRTNWRTGVPVFGG